jgi:hypothetical protein
MKLILDTFTCEKYTFPINRIVPQPEDVKEKLEYTDYVLAIELLIVEETTIRQHLRIGSTPPTRIGLNASEEHKRIQKLVYDNFGLTYICR